MANVIIAIHGLGNKPPLKLLEHWWKLAMMEGLRSLNLKPVFPKFELVYWADILHEKPLRLSEKNIKSPFYMGEKYVKAPADFPAEDHSTRRKVVDYLGRQMNRIFLNEDLSLNYSFISDAIISKYFKDLEIYYTETPISANYDGRKANELIKERLAVKLMAHRDDDIMLISHSMGSVIAFDVLTGLSPDIRINTFITIGSPLGFPFIISKIASGQKHEGNHTSHVITPGSILKHWYNYSDILDKVAFNYKLSDDFSENGFGVKPVDFIVVNNYEVNGIRNPHKSYGYLRTPEFANILNEFILSEELTLEQKISRRFVHFIHYLKTQFSIHD